MKVSLAVIGCGNFARRQHLNNLSSVEDAHLRAVCDLDQETVEQVQSQFSAEYATTDLSAVLNDKEVDALVVCVRDHLQAGIAIAALEAGKHVYLEKPGADKESDFKLLIDARNVSKLKVAVGFQKRFSPAYQFAKTAIQKGGGARNIFIRMTDDAWRWAKGYEPGSLLRHDVCHLFDLLRWITESEITSVYCVSSRPDDDAIVLTLGNGCIATVMNSGHATMDFPKERMEVVCQRGSVTLDDFVEVRTYGIEEVSAVKTFGGHCTKSGDIWHSHVFSKMGIEGMRQVRKSIWETRKKMESSDIEMTEAELEYGRLLPNFLRDQGWLQSLEQFVTALSRNQPLEQHAKIEDAWSASKIVDASIISRKDRQVVSLNNY